MDVDGIQEVFGKRLFRHCRIIDRTRANRVNNLENEQMEAPEEVSDVELVVEGEKVFHMGRTGDWKEREET